MIGNRLLKVAEYVKGERMADIGSDHAYLPIHLVSSEQISYAVAGEIVDGPFQAAAKNVASHGLSGRISVRKGSGLEVIEKGEVDCITICGMGGPLISDILLTGSKKLADKPRLILQSNIHSAAVRNALMKLGYQIIAEDIIKEKKHIYEIMVAEAGEMQLSDAEMKFGPYLLKEQNETFNEKWQKEYLHLQRIEQTIIDKPAQQEKLQEIEAQLKLYQEAIHFANQRITATDQSSHSVR
ncbi:tRNA (adenine(22)-N(1))-methyltransferase [Macrococcus carouselicus]|uniref:tRNA (Adenine(22)-N(1))-methyltransferase TrmK n=1 Tax=Macrococcus carouselicus TaxID=69969 RepID=A0A9Q8CNF5_9STAP|nr:tRNA (adenine(22)-N(1))-methyltransferase TrmK [Macrococcus carouselicus]TDM04367.1 tRNA (adenine(22)-N(1))-methyltransferase TrmK [Macrococcus carouselicus]